MVVGAQTLARRSEAVGDDAPAKVTLPAFRSDYGYVVVLNVFTKALEVIGDKVDIPESRLADGGRKLRDYVNEDLVENFSSPELDEISQLAAPSTVLLSRAHYLRRDNGAAVPDSKNKTVVIIV